MGKNVKTDKKATINYAKELTALKTRLEKAIGRKFETRKDNASVYEKDGNAYSFVLELGQGGAKTRFQTWLTARKNGIKIDCFVGTTYIATGTIDIKTLSQYRKDSDFNCGGSYRNVSESDLIKFFADNDLIIKKETKTKTKTETKAKETVKESETATA